MDFLSDNAAPAHPAVMAAIAEANVADTGYDGDQWSARMDAAFSALFETKVRSMWVSTGTAANALALTALCPPHGSVICHREAHIQTDECGAPEFYTHGAKLVLADGDGAKLDPATIAALLDATRNDVHQVQPAAVSITNATEYGRVYTPDDVAAIGRLTADRKLGLHMDGARFANAVARLGCNPGDLTWRAGVDVLSFGFVKNGGMNAEALIFFRGTMADAMLYRRKRAGHLLSKGRYLAAQILAMLDNDLWLENARTANAGATMLAEAAGDRLLHPVEANELFLRLSPEEAAALREQGFRFYDWGAGQARLVVSWDRTADDIAPLAAAIAAL
jgi:threonine aldolase